MVSSPIVAITSDLLSVADSAFSFAFVGVHPANKNITADPVITFTKLFFIINKTPSLT